MKKINSLTGGSTPLFAWKLPTEIATYKVAKMPATQWINVIKGFAQKGIKSAEIEDSRVMEHLAEIGSAQVTRDDLAEFVSYSLPSIKELSLSGDDAQYRKYSWSLGGSKKSYTETLFYFPTVIEDYDDRIADLDEAISVLSFDLDKLGEDPDVVFRLNDKRELLFARKAAERNGEKLGNAYERTSTHFSGTLTRICPDARADFAHMRWSIMEVENVRTLFVHEFQSDWAQRGRKEAEAIQQREMKNALELAKPLMTDEEKNTANTPNYRPPTKAEEELYVKYVGPLPGAPEWKGSYKKAPLVADTEHWANFCLRRAMLLAVEHNCADLTWINGGSMINGGCMENTGTSDFYQKIVCNLAKKLAKPYKSELVLKTYTLQGGDGDMVENRLAVMPVTEDMRNKMSIRSPIYSYANVLANATFDPIKARQLQCALQAESNQMFGATDAMRVSVVREILSACDESRPAGALIGKAASIAFDAVDPVAAMRHEAFHFAFAYHFDARVKKEILSQFQPGSPLLVRTMRLLLAEGNAKAAYQCSQSPEEAAAHAFALWKDGFMKMDKIEALVSGAMRIPALRVIATYFPAAEEYVRKVAAWIRGTSASPTDFVARIVRIHERVKEAPEFQTPAYDHDEVSNIDDTLVVGGR